MRNCTWRHAHIMTLRCLMLYADHRPRPPQPSFASPGIRNGVIPRQCRTNFFHLEVLCRFVVRHFR